MDVVFGASPRAEWFIRNLGRDRFAFVVDSDPRKHGEVCAGLPVMQPEAVLNYSIDEVVILSIKAEEVRRQLRQIGFRGAVRLPRADEFAAQVLLTEEGRGRAASTVTGLTTVLEAELGRPPVAMSGTALGIVRAGDFIHWDSDVDLLVYGVTVDRVSAVLGLQRSVDQIQVAESYIRCQLLIDRADRIERLPCSIDVVDGCPPTITQIMFGRSWVFSADDFRAPDWGRLRGHKIAVPRNSEFYLECIYGEDWRVPRSDWTIEDYRQQ